MSTFHMKKILLLGSNSFTGRYFKEYIKTKRLNEEFLLFGADRQEIDNDESRVLQYRKVNLLEKSELENLILDIKPDYIINIVGTFAANSYEEYLNVNADISRHIFEIIVEKGLSIEKILLIGSAAEYGSVVKLPIEENSVGKPVNFYGLTKLIQTNIAMYYYNNYGININVARTFNIIGRGISNKLSVGNFLEQIEKASEGECIKVGNLKSKRDYLHIEDVIDAYWKIVTHGAPGEIYNVCSGKSCSMEELLKGLIKMSGKDLNIITDENFLKQKDVSDVYGDNTKLKKHTGWQPKKEIIKDLM